MKKNASFVLMVYLLAFAIGWFSAKPTLAAPSHIVISEIQITGAAPTDEFVELYNPTAAPVNLLGWRLSRRTASGNQTNLLTSFPDIILPAGGYFLIAHPTGYTGAVAADAAYSTSESIAANNSVVLFSDAGKTIVDLVGLGTASSFETAAALNPPSGQSIARRREVDEIIDSDNNASDFLLMELPTPMGLTLSPPPDSAPPEPDLPEEEQPLLPPPADDSSDSAEAEEETPPSANSGGGGLPLILAGDILINEFVSDPSDGDEEWVELINRTGRAVDLNGWMIEDGGEHQTILNGSIGAAPNNFFVVAKPKGNFNNGGDRIIIKTQAGQIIDQISYGGWDDGSIDDNAPLARDPMSTARSIDGFTIGNAAMDFTTTLTPTRGKANIITTAGSALPAGPATLRLSELFPNPAGSDRAEFIEVINIGNSEVSIVGWSIADASGARYTMREKDFDDAMILPGAYLALPRALTGIALNNSGGETVRLFFPNSLSPVHEVSYTGSAPEGASYADFASQWFWTTSVTSGAANVLAKSNRLPLAALAGPSSGAVGQALSFSAEDSTDPDGDFLIFKWAFGDGESGAGEIVTHTYTKSGRYRVKLAVDDGRGGLATAEKSIIIEAAVAPYPQVLGISAAAVSAEIILSEIFPAPPKGEEEWLELHNAGDETVSLASWSLGDASGRTYTLPPDSVILPRSYLVLKKSQTRLSLNNTGDEVMLFGPIGEIADETAYPSAKIGMSWMRDEYDDWDWTSSPTPLAENVLRLVEDHSPSKTTAISAAKQTPSGAITVSGIVTAAPGMIGERVLYIGNIKAEGLPQNLRVDLPAGQVAANINLNDEIRVSGKIRQVQGELRMSLADDGLAVLSSGNTPLESMPLDDIIGNDWGRLVIASGTVATKTSGGFVMELADGETIRVIVAPPLKSKLAYPVGAAVTAAGILSHTNAGARILLRMEQDLAVRASPLVSESAPIDAPTPVLSSYLVITILGSLILIGALAYRFRQKRAQLSSLIVEGLDEEEMV